MELYLHSSCISVESCLIKPYRYIVQLPVLRYIYEASYYHLESKSWSVLSFHAVFLLGSFFDPEDGGDMFL
jgi:hypothetical protein